MTVTVTHKFAPRVRCGALWPGLVQATMLAQLRHKNLVQFYGIAPSLVIKGEEGRCIITEFCSEGSLKDVLEQAEKDRVYGKETATVDKYGADWQTVWAKDIAQGMAYLHQGVRDYPIMHGDLKSLNILVSSEHKIKICDFGSAQNMVGSGLDSASKGTTPWNAPELINNPKGANENCDIWSYGVVLWELLTLKIPFEEFLSQDPNGFSLMFHLGHGWPKNAETAADAGEEPDPPLPIDNFPKSFQYVLRQCWQLDPTKRMKFDRIVGELDRGEKGQEAREFLNKKDEWEAQMQSEMAKVNEESKRLKEDMKRRDEDLEKKKSMIVDLEAQVMYMKYFMYGLIGMFVLIGVVWAVLYVSSGTEDAVSDKKANDIFKQDAGEDNFLDEAELDRALRKVLPHSQFLDTKRILASYDSNHTRGNTKLDRDEFENLVAHEQSQFGWLHRELSEQWHRRTGYNLPSLGAALRWTKEHMGGQTMVPCPRRRRALCAVRLFFTPRPHPASIFSLCASQRSTPCPLGLSPGLVATFLLTRFVLKMPKRKKERMRPPNRARAATR